MRLKVIPYTSYYEKSNIISSCFTCIIKMCPSKYPKNMQYDCVYKNNTYHCMLSLYFIQRYNI